MLGLCVVNTGFAAWQDALTNVAAFADIRNTKRIAGVLLRGRWLDRAQLDGMLRQVGESARSGCRGAFVTPK